MAGPLFSASWYRVAGLRPRLRSHARIQRHDYRGQTWHVLHDLLTERSYRFSPSAHRVIGLMDGRRTVQEIWGAASGQLGDDAPTQDEVIGLLGQLHAADVLQCDVPPDAAEILRRRQQQQRRRWTRSLSSVFFWRIPLFDPERLLRALQPLVRPFLGWFGVLLWLAVVGPAVVLAATHWTDLTRGMLDRVFTAHNLVLLWLLFPLLKAFHEFGHGVLVKARGGEVHVMGVMFLVFTPIPYVDASAASAFRSKWQRIAVGAGGMLAELFVAALALVVWLSAEPGLVRTLAYNAVFIAGVSTVLFNGNPLLRFDAYYMLADLLEIPNLGPRANAYLKYLCVRYLFGEREGEPPQATPGERAWFVPYAIASFAYRAMVAVAIILFVAERLLGVGVLLAILAVAAWFLVPAGRGIAFLLTSPRLRKVRARAIAVTGIAVGGLAALLTLAPVPYRTRAEGVVWVPEEATVRAGTEGFVERVLALPGARVGPEEALFVLADPELTAQVQVLVARRRELLARHREQTTKDRVKAAMIEDELRYVEERLAEARRRAAELVVQSQARGTFVPKDRFVGEGCACAGMQESLPGRFVKKGDLMGYVLEPGTVTVRAIVSQADLDLVGQRAGPVEVRLAERLADPIRAAVRRMVPGASERLPATALGSEGGGRIPVDPRDAQGVTAVEKVFQVDLELDTPLPLVNVGGRVYVRFDHGREPLALQWYRAVRQLFLARFNV